MLRESLPASRRLHVLLLVLLAVLLRLPFWIEALRTPLDGDEAIVGLMSIHLGRGLTIWGQPFGSPLEAVLAAPFVAAFGHSLAALRAPYFALGILLVVVVYFLAERLHQRAALPAGVLVACPAPYLLIIASLAPTSYPSTLVLGGLLLLLALRLGDRLEAGEPVRSWLAIWGGLAGLAIWTHVMSASVVAASGAYLLWRARRRPLGMIIPALAVLTVSAPWWSQGVRDALRIVRLSGPGKPLAPHLAQALPNVLTATGGLLGIRTPLIADDPHYVLSASIWLAALLVLAHGLLLARALLAARRASSVILLLVVICLVLAAFPFPQRSGPHTIRHLTLVYAPLSALAGFAVATGSRHVLAWTAVGVIVTGNLVGGVRLLRAWRTTDRASAPFLLPDLAPVVDVLEAHGIRRAYASYGPAYRLTYETGERVIASQPWNERFRHFPLPYLDEVRFAKGVAWILTPGVPSDLPTPEAFEAGLREGGGSWTRTEAGPAVIYHDFVPPASSAVARLPAAGPAGDGQTSTALVGAGKPITFHLPAPMSLDGVTLLAPSQGPRLPRALDVEISSDGATFETVLSRRRGQERTRPLWVNGHPQYVADHGVVMIPLHGRTVAAIRFTPVTRDAWSLAEVLLHPSQANGARESWSEWLDPTLSWEARVRALTASPLRDRADWHYRVVLAKRALGNPGPGPG